jgi:anthranilate/para-aminobenzoate synthase component II
MILLLDNYDSFTFNLYQAIAALGAEVEVHRNDALTVDQVLARACSHRSLARAGQAVRRGHPTQLLRRLPDSILLGVCLGHQGLVERCGGPRARSRADARRASLVHHDGDALFRGLPNPFPAGRYHSRCARRGAPPELRLTAWTAEDSSWPFATRSSRASACSSIPNPS